MLWNQKKNENRRKKILKVNKKNIFPAFSVRRRTTEKRELGIFPKIVVDVAKGKKPKKSKIKALKRH